MKNCICHEQPTFIFYHYFRIISNTYNLDVRSTRNDTMININKQKKSFDEIL